MKLFPGKLCALLAALMLFAGPVHARFVSLGYVDLPSHEVSAALIQHVLERLGYNVGVKKGTANQVFAKVGNGDLDLLVAATLPAADKADWDEYQENLVKVAQLYDGARRIWAVPDYVPASEVKSVGDLGKPAVAEKMDKTIRSPDEDADLTAGSKKIVDRYKLAEAGYQFAPAKTADWIDGFNRNIAEKKWFVMPLRRPQYLNRAARLRVLDDPENLLGGTDKVYLVAHKDVRTKIDKYAHYVLSKMELSLRAIEEMEAMMAAEKMSARDAARQWIGSHPNTLSYWLEPDER